MENGNQPINPCTIKGEQIYTDLPFTHDVNMIGLTKREYFAALAMQGLLSNPNIRRPNHDDENGHKEFANVCLQYADGLLKELDNTEE
jgi:hypothetical protein